MAERVLLIGNGPGALSRRAGAEIDAFDGVVARFNEYHIAGYEAFVGTRTDEWITWVLFESRAKEEYARVLYSLPPPRKTLEVVRARYPHLRMIEDETFVRTRERMGYELPSSGAFAAMHYVLAGVEVVLYGFDFFQGPRHHYGDDGERGYRHSPNYEALFFRGLMREGKVSILGERDRAAAARAQPGAGLDEADPAWQRDEYKRVAGLRLAEIDRIQGELDNAWAKYEELVGSWRTLERERAEVGESWKTLHARNEALQAHVNNLILEKADLYEKYQGHERRLIELHARADALEQEKAAIGRSWQELAARNEDLQGHFDRVAAEKDALALELRLRTEEVRSLESRVARANEEAASQKLAREQTMTQLDLFGREASAAKAMLAGATAERDRAETERARVAAELEGARREAAGLRGELDALRDAVRQLRQRRVYGLLARSRLLPDRIDAP